MRQGLIRPVISRGALGLLLALCCAPAATGADWPMARGGPSRAGYASEQAAPPLTELWRFPAGEAIVSEPAVSGGVVYFGARDGKVYAVKPDGTQLWSYPTGGWVDAGPAVSTAGVFVPSLDGWLYALHPATGALLWKKPLGAGSSSPPLLLDGKVYLGTALPENKLKVFDSATGRQLGEFAALQPVDGPPSTDGTKVYFGSNDGQVYALYKNTLVKAWDYQTFGSLGAAALPVYGGVVYAPPSKYAKKLVALNPDGSLFDESHPVSDPAAVWMLAGSPAVSPDKVFVSSGENSTSLFAFRRGDLKATDWSASVALAGVSASGLLASPSVAGPAVYAPAPSGGLVVVSTAGADLLASLGSGPISLGAEIYSSPAVSGGRVFVATMGGELVCFEAGRAVSILSPNPGSVIASTPAVTAVVRNPALSSWTLEYGAGLSPASWVFVSSGAAAVAGSTIAYWGTAGLSNGDYTLRLRVTEIAAPALENEARTAVRVNAPPDPPSGLFAYDAPGDAGNRIVLEWDPPAVEMAAFRIYRSTGGAFSFLASVSTAPASYTDAAAVTGTTFTYRVRSWDGWLESADPASASAFAVNNDPSADVTAPAAVADLAASPGASGGSVSLAWTATGSDGNTGSASVYEIRYSTDAEDLALRFAAAGLWKPARPAGGASGFAEAETVSGLFGGTTYFFSLKAYDARGNYSAPSATASAPAARDLVPPGAPSGLAVTDANGDRGGVLNLSWTKSADDGAGAGDVYGYRVFRRAWGSSYDLSSPYASAAAGAAGYRDEGAPVNVRYCYKAAAYDSTNLSPLSGEACGVSADNWRFFDASAGGRLSFADGSSVDIAAGAASQNFSLLAARLDPVTYRPLMRTLAAGGPRPTGVVYAFSFDSANVRLTRPAVITLAYTHAEAAGLDEELLRLYALSGSAWTMVDSSVVDRSARKVSAEVVQFSTFSIMQYVPSGAVISETEVYTYPNPATGGSLTFKFRPAEKADVRVEVYNVAGEKVARLEKAACPAGLTSEIVWDLKGVASGVYVYRLKVYGASGDKTITKKLAVIR